jgi:DNA repair protein RadD
MIQFRPYQETAIQSARDKIAGGCKRILLNSPTGSGKTIIAAGIVQRAVAKGKRVLFLAHRRELIHQTCAKLVEGGVLNFGVIMAGHRINHAAAPVQVASIQTLVRRELPPADLVMVDECHRAASRSYLSVLANYPQAAVIGLSATPERLDGKGLDDIFHDMVVVATVPDLIEMGFLVKPTCYVGATADLSGVATRRGDYDEGQLAEAMDKPRLTGDIVANWLRLAKGRPTAVFAAGVEHARHITAEFVAAGIAAATVTGETPANEREAIIADWRAGFIQVCVNVFIFVEGFDFPELECVVLARPTQSVSLYLQAVGRVMRPSPDKTQAIIIDHAGCCQMHGQPHLHREWTLEGMAKKRKDQGQALHQVCQPCGMVFEAEPNWWLEETQPNIRPAFVPAAQRLLAGSEKGRGMAHCPGCSAASCLVCGDHFEVRARQVSVDGIATVNTTVCPTCAAVYGDVPRLLPADHDAYIPTTTDDDLVAMGDEVPLKVVVLNDYKRLINEAKRHGRKRGWAYWRLKEKYDDGVLRDCLPRHTGQWWKEQAR